MQRNRLAAETSPYLLQHADNPVDWYPWGEAALLAARQADKPILLSIGYSACHWCHVMAHESFEDPATADLMNRLFINIKVDREERPDLDKIYQTAQQLITHGSGGWPLTMFLTPATQAPFFGGTYFPKRPSHGMPAFSDLLQRVADYYHSQGSAIAEQNEQLKLALQRLEPQGASDDALLDRAPLLEARAALERVFDTRNGGFSQAPKFPNAGSTERCLRHWHSTSGSSDPDLKALYMASLSLTRMGEGGIYDHLGGGFSRYSVDAEWTIPHFEKMLYDNGLLLCEYARAAVATGEALFADVAAQTAEWVLREMRSPEGGFYSSLDADSEGHEGKFYVWTRAEIQSLLSGSEYAAFSRRFGLTAAPNFEGAWHLRVREPVESIAPELAHSPAQVVALIAAAREKLLTARVMRVWPARDEKILTAWNALMIKGLAIAARVLRRTDLADAATAAVDFIRHMLWRDGRLLATYKNGRAHLPAYLDDYAFLVDALLELLQTRWRSSDLEFAQQLTEVLLAQFADGSGGGFYFTAADHEQLIHRSKTFSDESMPAGNAVAVSVLTRLGYLLGEMRYLNAAERCLRAGWPMLQEYPLAHMSLVNSLEDYLSQMQVVIIRGDAALIKSWPQEIGALYAPLRMIFAIPGDAPGLPPALAAKAASTDTVAYLCTGMTCSAPISDLSALARALNSRS